MPGAEAPTTLTLPGIPGKVAIHAVCRENIFWETMEELKKAGASAILVLPIEKDDGLKCKQYYGIQFPPKNNSIDPTLNLSRSRKKLNSVSKI